MASFRKVLGGLPHWAVLFLHGTPYKGSNLSCLLGCYFDPLPNIPEAVSPDALFPQHSPRQGGPNNVSLSRDTRCLLKRELGAAAHTIKQDFRPRHESVPFLARLPAARLAQDARFWLSSTRASGSERAAHGRRSARPPPTVPERPELHGHPWAEPGGH